MSSPSLEMTVQRLTLQANLAAAIACSMGYVPMYTPQNYEQVIAFAKRIFKENPDKAIGTLQDMYWLASDHLRNFLQKQANVSQENRRKCTVQSLDKLACRLSLVRSIQLH